MAAAVLALHSLAKSVTAVSSSDIFLPSPHPSEFLPHFDKRQRDPEGGSDLDLDLNPEDSNWKNITTSSDDRRRGLVCRPFYLKLCTSRDPATYVECSHNMAQVEERASAAL